MNFVFDVAKGYYHGTLLNSANPKQESSQSSSLPRLLTPDEVHNTLILQRATGNNKIEFVEDIFNLNWITTL